MTSSIGPLRLENRERIIKDNEMAEVLNDYFASVFTVEDIGSIEKMSPPHRNGIPLSNCDFTEDAIIKVFDSIKVNKTQGARPHRTTGSQRN